MHGIMTAPRLKAELWVKALIRRCWAAEVPALLLRRGEESSGAVFVRCSPAPGQAVVYARGMLPSGDWGWRRATGPEPVPDDKAADYLERQGRFDPDFWVVEIEAPALAPFVDDPIED